MNTAPNLGSTAGGHRLLVAAALLATFMQSMNISIPNAAVLHVQGSLSMTDDEIGWVFSSYIAASALIMPMVGWLAATFGRKTVFQISIVIFTFALIFVTRATTPLEFVFARIIQGAASGTLAPIAMAILIEEFPSPLHPRIGMTWTAASLLGMLTGPSIGGWLSENYDWRSIFYISLPAIAFIFMAMGFWLNEKKADKSPPFDFFGWAAFSMGIAGLQMMLDRGERLDWFYSTEIWIEAIVSMLGFYFFAVNIATKQVHLFNKALFRDRNFCLSTVMYFGLGFVLLPTLALTSPMLELLLGYSPDTAGAITIPRGAALISGFLLMTRAPARIDNRLIVIASTGLVIYGTWSMLGYSPLMDCWPVITAGVLQGLGLGILMPALTKAAFSTLDPKFRPEGTQLFNLSRLYGSTIGIAVVQMFFYYNTQSMHLALAKHVKSYGAEPFTGSALAMFNEMVTGQAALIAIIGQFKLLMIAMIVVSPLALLLRKPNLAPVIRGGTQ